MKYTRVKWLKSHHEFGYNAGEFGDVAEDRLSELSEGGFVVVAPGKETAESKTAGKETAGKGAAGSEKK